MEVTLDLNPEAYQVAEELAAERHLSIAEFVSEAILHQRSSPSGQKGDIEIDDEGWPVLRFGHPLTLEEARSLVEEA